MQIHGHIYNDTVLNLYVLSHRATLCFIKAFSLSITLQFIAYFTFVLKGGKILFTIVIILF